LIMFFRGEMSERIYSARTVTERKANRTLREKESIKPHFARERSSKSPQRLRRGLCCVLEDNSKQSINERLFLSRRNITKNQTSRRSLIFSFSSLQSFIKGYQRWGVVTQDYR